MRLFNRTLLIGFLLTLCASFYAAAQTFTGPTSVCPATGGTGIQYTYSDDVPYSTVTWSVTGGGTIVSGTGLSRFIRWSSDGSVTVQLKNSSGVVVSQDTKNVSIYVAGTISAPSSICGGSANISNTGYYGTSFTWKSSTDGTTYTTLGDFGPTLTVSPTTTTWYKQLPTGCHTSTTSNAIQIVYNAPTVAGTLVVNSGATSCSSGIVNLGFSSNPTGTIQWDYRYKDGIAGPWNAWSTFSTGTTPSNSFSVSSTATLDRYYEFRVIVQNGSCAALTGNTVSATVFVTPTIGTLSVLPGTTFYGSSGALNLSVTSSLGALVYEASINGTTWSTISNPTPSLSQSMQIRAKVSNGTCATAYSNVVTVNVYPSPNITVTGPTAIPLGVTTNLTVQSAFSDYQWIKDNIDIPGATLTAYTVREPGEYKVKIRGNAGAPWVYALPVTISSSLLSQTQAINYKVVTSINKQGFTTASNVYSLEPHEVTQAVDYMDGHGRTVQSIAIGQTPGRKDLVIPTPFTDAKPWTKNYLPYGAAVVDGRYKPYAVRASGGTYSGSDQYSFYQTGGVVANDTVPYSKSVFEQSPLSRVLENGGVGSDWRAGAGHSVQFFYYTNMNSSPSAALKDIRIWTVNGPSGMYADYQLEISKTIDENGNAIWSFSDKLGRTVLKRVQLDETVEGVSTPFLDTYYVYDDRGNLAIQVPPKAVAKINSGTTWDPTFRDEWCFVSTYDERNRLVEKKVPDAAPVYFAYDRLDRLVLVQDGYQRALNKWAYVKYDIKGRVVMSGLYLNTTHTTRSTIQANVLDPLYSSGIWYEEKGSALHGYTNVSFPTTGAVIYTVSYYDNHDFDNNGADDYSYSPQSLNGEEIQGRSFGRVTGSKRIIPGTSTFLTLYVFYDRLGRLSQVRSNNHVSSTIDNLTTYVYNFNGTTKYAKTIHKGVGGTTVTVLQRPEYDHSERVIKVFFTIDGGTEILAAAYVYNELGQLVDKKLHSTNGVAFLQSIDYRYTIKGWTKSINNAQLTINAANNDDGNDYFGLEMLYNTTEAGLNDQIGDQRYWNGNISAIKWKAQGGTTGNVDQRSYKYQYDKGDKLKNATFQAYATSSWTKETGTLNESMSYDANGNIKTLVRKRNLRGLSGATITSTSQTIDDLSYTYASGNGNKLTSVEDAISGVIGQNGFNNGQSVGNEYSYNAVGSLTGDKNKGIDSVHYNDLGKVRRIKFTDGRVNTYFYDAEGTKIVMKMFQGTTLVLKTDYVGQFVYENNALSFFGSPEGRVVKKASSYEYQYSIGDHQGNTRVVFSSVATPITDPLATFEGDSNDKSNQYTFDPSFVATFASANHSTPGSKVIKMNQTYKIGPSKSTKVFPGDKIDLEVWEYHEGSSGFGTTSTPVATLVSMVSTAFGGVSGGAGESGQIYNGINSAINGFVPAGNQGSARPAAYLNYIIFDREYKVLDMGWQLVPATTFTKQKVSFPTLNIKEAGYVFTYLSYDNDSNSWVYFDDFKVTHTPSNVIQYNEYYPFGLQTAASWTRDGSKNEYLYNAGNELNQNSQWYETFFRGYDPALGKFLQVDQMADKYASFTPYNYAFNDPVLINDPFGDDGLDNRNNWASMGGCGCWQDDGPQDASAGMYGSSWSSGNQGAAVSNPGFSNRLWNAIGGLINTMWSSTSANGASTWENGGDGPHYYDQQKDGSYKEVSGAGSSFRAKYQGSPLHNKYDFAWRRGRPHFKGLGKKLTLDDILKTDGTTDADNNISFGNFVDPKTLKLKKIGEAYYIEARYREVIFYGIRVARLNMYINIYFKPTSADGKKLTKAESKVKLAKAMDWARGIVYEGLRLNLVSNKSAQTSFIGGLNFGMSLEFEGPFLASTTVKMPGARPSIVGFRSFIIF